MIKILTTITKMKCVSSNDIILCNYMREEDTQTDGHVTQLIPDAVNNLLQAKCMFPFFTMFLTYRSFLPRFFCIVKTNYLNALNELVRFRSKI